jgi:hypothetical protein
LIHEENSGLYKVDNFGIMSCRKRRYNAEKLMKEITKFSALITTDLQHLIQS